MPRKRSTVSAPPPALTESCATAAPAIGSTAYWAAEVQLLERARLDCKAGSSAFSLVSAGIREAVRQHTAALAAEPKPAQQHPADEAPAAFRARLDAAAAAMTDQELEPFAAELLRRHAHTLTCDPRTGRLSLAPLGAG